MSPWIKVGAIVALLLGTWFYSAHVTQTAADLKATRAQLQATEAARATEHQWQEKYDGIVRMQQENLGRIDQRLRITLDELRRRPERLPEAARAQCQGATGAELSRTDGEFLGRESARADGIREGLRACYAALDAAP